MSYCMSFSFILFCKYVSKEMFPKEKLLTDFILWTECAFITLDGLNISMFRLPLRRKYIMFGWIFGSFGISKPCYMYFHYLSIVFYYSVSYREYAAPTVRETVECPFALVVSGPTPSVTNWTHNQVHGMWIPETCLFFIYCVHAWGEAWSKHEKDPCMIQRSPMWSMEF